MEETFRDFVYRIISPAMSEEYARLLVSDIPLDKYFRRAFTHKTFYMNRAAKQGKFDYEVLEKIGDRVLASSFQMWLYDIIGNEVTVPQPYSVMEIRLTGTDYLSELCDLLGFSKWVRPAQEEGLYLTPNIKEDVFEAFIAAIVLAADEFLVKDMGYVLAKRWIYVVYNTYTRDKIDPRNASMYVDARSQINEVWSFNGWKTPFYKISGDGKGIKEAGLRGKATAELVGPSTDNFPARFRNKKIGEGEGPTLAIAKENAAIAALKYLDVNFPELVQGEITFNGLETARLDKILGGNAKLLAETKKVLKDKEDIYQSISIRRLKLFNMFVVQLRVKIEGIWKSGGRARSPKSEEEAIEKVMSIFIEKAGRGELG